MTLHQGPTALWVETVYNRRIQFIDINLFSMSSGASEWAQRSARVKRAVRSRRMSERCEQTSERTSEWPFTLRVDFIYFLPTVHGSEDDPLSTPARHISHPSLARPLRSLAHPVARARSNKISLLIDDKWRKWTKTKRQMIRQTRKTVASSVDKREKSWIWAHPLQEVYLQSKKQL